MRNSILAVVNFNIALFALRSVAHNPQIFLNSNEKEEKAEAEGGCAANQKKIPRSQIFEATLFRTIDAHSQDYKLHRDETTDNLLGLHSGIISAAILNGQIYTHPSE